jgi:TnpA family transposase
LFLATLRFRSDDLNDPLLAGVSFMHKANGASSPNWAEAPLQFVPPRWLPHVKAAGKISPVFYEICLLSELAEAIHTGQIWVEHSRTHVNLRTTWIQDATWPQERETLVEKHPQLDSVDRLLKDLGDALDERIKDVDTHWPEFARNVVIENNELKLKRLEAVNLPSGTKQVAKLIRGALQKATLPELLTDIHARTGFADFLTSLNPQRRKIEQLIGRKFAVLMALGMNIGLQNMANAIKEATYDELAWVSDWFVREDTLQVALRSMVEAMLAVPITKRWGDGTTASSDGELFGVMAKALYADINPHAFDIGPAISVYTHLSDNFIPFYSQILPSRTREAAYVLDGLYYHQTDLHIDEHYTDTGGYTDIMFCMCHVDGLLFAPRLRNLAGRRLFAINKDVLSRTSHIGVLFDGVINTRIVKAGYDDLLRLHVSMKKGIVTASTAMRKLGLHHPQSALFRAAQEIGRAVKTLYILDYIRDPALRRRVLIGLNKGESYHALNRSLCIGYQGLLRSPSIQEQANQTLALRLLATAIMLWNAIHIDLAVTSLRTQGHTITDHQLEHIYPMMLEHINIIGEYRLPSDDTINQAIQKLRRQQPTMSRR